MVIKLISDLPPKEGHNHTGYKALIFDIRPTSKRRSAAHWL